MIWTIIIFLVLLSILVLAHEWGHYITARLFGMKVEEFGLGFPPRIFSWRSKKTGVRWSLNSIPIGGFVKIKGESRDEQEQGPDAFSSKSIPKRFVVLVSGVVMNLVAAALFFMIAVGVGSPMIVEDYAGTARIENQKLQITQIIEGSPAQEAGLRMGDEIVAIDGNEYTNAQEARTYLHGFSQDEIVQIQARRGEEMIEATMISAYVEQLDRAGFGLAVYETGIVRYPWYEIPWRGIQTAYWYTEQICLGFAALIAGLFTSQGPDVAVSGPVGIAMMTAEAAALGFVYILQFGAVLSINLAILNILPIPALDGGRIVFLAIEGIARKPVSPKVEAAIHNIGFLLLLLLVLFVTYKDVLGLFDA